MNVNLHSREADSERLPVLDAGRNGHADLALFHTGIAQRPRGLDKLDGFVDPLGRFLKADVDHTLCPLGPEPKGRKVLKWIETSPCPSCSLLATEPARKLAKDLPEEVLWINVGSIIPLLLMASKVSERITLVLLGTLASSKRILGGRVVCCPLLVVR